MSREKITTLAELIAASERRKAVTCPNLACFARPIPASVVANMQARLVHRLLTAGMFVYKAKKRA